MGRVLSEVRVAIHGIRPVICCDRVDLAAHQAELLVDVNLHEVALCRHAGNADGGAGVGNRHAGPAQVANGRIRCNPIALGVVEFGIGRQAAVAAFDAVGMQTHDVRLVEAECCVVGLNARAPDTAVVGTEQ